MALTSSATRGTYYALNAHHPKHRIHLIGFDQDLVLPIREGDIDAVVAVKSAEIGRLISKLACERVQHKNWGGPYIVSPFLITPSNIDSAEVAAQMDGQWFEFADENK